MKSDNIVKQHEITGLIRINGNWEPEFFLRRRGDGTFLDVEKLWKDIHSDQAIERMKRIGINYSHIHFHKGFGLEFEKESIKEAAEWAEKLHNANIKVGVYIGCTLFTEVFNHPNVDKMLTTDGISWGEQYYRCFWCYNSPYAIDYFKKVIQIAINDIKADVLHFDHAFSFYLDRLCHCEFCLSKFKDFCLKEKDILGPASGYKDVTQLSPPPSGRVSLLSSLNSLKDPASIAWSRFHAEAGNKAFLTLANYARSLKNDIGIFFNGCSLSGLSVYSRPQMEIENMYIADMGCVEDTHYNPPGQVIDEIVISRFRAYKMATRAKTAVMYYVTEEGLNNKLLMAEAAAFNYRALGFVELSMQLNHTLKDDEIRFVNLIIKNENLFVQRQPWHNVAVLRHHDSMLINQFPCCLSPFVIEQILFENHIPFTIIGERELSAKKLSLEFDLLILPDCKCLSENESEEITDFVNLGGRVLSLGNTGTANCYNQINKVWSLYKIFSREALPCIPDSSVNEIAGVTTPAEMKKDIKSSILRTEKASHIPSIDFTLPEKSSESEYMGFQWFNYRYWKMPANKDIILSEINRLLHGRIFYEVKGIPTYVGMETYRTENGLRFFFVNFKHPEIISNAGIRINLSKSEIGNSCATWFNFIDRKKISADQENWLTLPDFNLMGILELK